MPIGFYRKIPEIRPRLPIEKIKTLALDDRSRTSVALLKILFADRFGPDVKLTSSPPDPEAMLKTHDAALIIGDQAFSLPKLPTETKVYDLSQEWFLETRKTFVHAVVNFGNKNPRFR